MGSGAVIYIPSFIKISSGIQKLIRGDTQAHRQHDDSISLLLFFQNKGSRLKRTKRTRYWGSIPDRNRDFSLLCSIHTGHGGHPTSCLMDTGQFFHLGQSCRGLKLTTHLVPRLRMYGTVPPLQCLLMASCLIKPRDHFTFLSKVVLWI
jgi:hypothetical protein